MSGSGNTTSLEDIASFELDDSDMERLEDSLAEEETVDESGHASHIITVRYDNGATRVYKSKAQVESVQLAYCSTVAKCQGSQFDTAIIICHHAQKAQLSREWLYTAITRASKRVIVRYAISRQRIKGRDLKEKILRYQDLLNGEAKNAYGVKMKANIPLAIEEYDSSVSTFEVVGNGG
jgi:superfamily I DNA/RNA helicase